MAAAALIAKEAGCVIVDTKREEFNLLNRRFLVSATTELANEVLKLIDTVDYPSD